MRHAHPPHPRGWDGHGGHHRGHRGHPALGKPSGPQTFRRGRALQFLEFLNVRRTTLLRQLDQPEFADLRPTLLGELKAVESVRDEFMAMFDLWADAEEAPDPSTSGTSMPVVGETPPTHHGAETEAKAEEAGEQGSSGSGRGDPGDRPEEDRSR
ncbi:hypothetical protein [Alicyclobacillus sendaiensis]|uniref:hypothetical protein n=1 Tax=Alicyclobacillus sendaiensis TaxID=192387 RepID=UPI0026F43EBA|nr:hypothetical protein [Alicyclobacillus sendaiensis]